jgi:hypothetical protein
MATDPTMLSDWYDEYMKAAPATAATVTAPPVAGTAEWTPTADATVAGQVNKLVTQGSPLIDQAQTAAKQQANRRGMLNSTMAITAGQDAAYRAAMPIAQQDAQTFANAGQFNAGAKNQAMLQGAGLTQQANITNAAATNQAQTLQQQAGIQSGQMQQQADIARSQIQQQYDNQRQMLTAQTDEQLRLIDAQNGTKLADAYRQTSQNTYDAYITDIQRIQESDMDADVKAAQVANLQGLYQTRQEYINTIFKFAPGWSDDWSQFAVEFGEAQPAGA